MTSRVEAFTGKTGPRNMALTPAVRLHMPSARIEARKLNPALNGYIGHCNGFFYFQQTGNPELVRVQMTAAQKLAVGQ